MLTINTGDLI